MASSRGDTFYELLRRALTDTRSYVRDNIGVNLVGGKTGDVVIANGNAGELVSKVGRNELLAKLLSTAFAMAASFGMTYFLLKWLSNILDPTRKDMHDETTKAKKMLQVLKVKDLKLTNHELCVAANLVDPQNLSVNWQDIGGLENAIEQIKETVIFPFRRRDLFQDSSLIQAPKGVLFYGPPGCGKTMLAKAVAKSAGARFINLQVSSMFDKWVGESQKRAGAVFTLAIKLQPSIIFIDEIDSFLRSRQSIDQETTAMVKALFMSLWDGLMTTPNCQVMVIGATNRPNDVDEAILRRMPCKIRIGKPGKVQRSNILKIFLKNEQVEDLDYDRLGEITPEFSGSDLEEVCRVAALNRVHEYLQSAREELGEDVYNSDSPLPYMRPISMADFTYAVAKVTDSKLQSPSQVLFERLD